MNKLALSLAVTTFFGTAVSAQDLTYEIYGGVALQDTSGLNYNTSRFPMDHGSALGAGIYLAPIAGFEFGVDLMVTDRRYTGFATGVETTSLMLNARYPFAISSGLDGYVGLGLGAIDVEYDGGTAFAGFSGNEVVAGGQVSLGARYSLASGQVFSEIKYQTAFDDALIVGQTVEYNSTSLLFGYRF